MATKVKICGITKWTDAKMAIDEGAFAIGLNFYAPSPRFVSVRDARRIVLKAQHEVETVGVFVNDSREDVDDIASIAGVDVLQLHGEESPEAVADLAETWEVWKAFRVGKGFSVATLQRYAPCRAFLLDGFSSRARGGTGVSFDWSIAREAKRHGRIVLAGGLTPGNVGAAIRAARPYAVDVASGVEARPGKKDPRKVRAFMEAVRMADRSVA